MTMRRKGGSHWPVWKPSGSESIQKRSFLAFQFQFGKRCRVQKGSGMRNGRHLLLTMVLALLSPVARAQVSGGGGPELVIGAAADLSSVLQEISDQFESRAHVKVRLSFGASGALAQQIENGAPFDVFFSADMDYPRRLIAENQADPSSLYQYAVGKLVLWVPAESPLDVEHKGMSVLMDPAVKKIAAANPDHAPYGRAAVAALKHEDLYDRVKDRLVMGENVSQAAQFVESGNAQAGFVALAHAVAPAMKGKGKYWTVPTRDYPQLAQGVVVLTRSQHKKEADDFLNYIKTKDARELLRKYGFSESQE